MPSFLGFENLFAIYIYIYINNPLPNAAFGADCLTPFQNFENHNSRSKKWILVILSRIATCCKNVQILIRSPLQVMCLHLLSKFEGYIFNGLGENKFENYHLKYSVSTLIDCPEFCPRSYTL